MKLFKQRRRERALARFAVRAQRPDEEDVQYEAYLFRKKAEKDSLAQTRSA